MSSPERKKILKPEVDMGLFSADRRQSDKSKASPSPFKKKNVVMCKFCGGKTCYNEDWNRTTE